MSRPKSRYVPALDGLRAFGVLVVIAYHMNMPWAPGGLLGVTMFFVLSGYLITCLLLAEFDYSGTISLKDFWYRRVRRIIPAVVTCVIGTAALCTLFNHALLTKMRPDMIPTLLFFNNWWQIVHNVSYFENLGAPSPLTHCWSLSIEEQFYVIWPIVLLICLKLGVKRTNIQKGLVVFICISALLMALLFSPTEDPSRVYYGTDTRAFSLMIGALLAFLWPYSKLTDSSGSDMSGQGRLVFNIVGFAAFAGLVLMVGFSNGFSPFIYRGGLVLCSVLTALTMAVLVHPASILSRVFALKPLVWIGKISYGMYLWHFPILLLMTPGNLAGQAPLWLRFLQLAVVFGVSAFSYYCIENPLRHGALGRFYHGLKDGAYTFVEWFRAHAVPAVVGTAVVVVALLGCAFVPDTNALEGGNLLKNEAAQTGSHADPAAGTTEPEKGTDSTYSVLMIGDSVSVRVIPYFMYDFPYGHIDAQVNRQFFDIENVYDPYAEAGTTGDVIVVALGTNGVVTSDQIEAFLKDVGDGKRVFFVNTRSSADWMETTNQALSDAANRHANVSLIDWYSLSDNHTDWFDGDGTHLSIAGAKAYTDMIYDAIHEFLPVYTDEELETKRLQNAAAADTDSDGYDDTLGLPVFDQDGNGAADDSDNDGTPDSVQNQPADE